MKNILFLLLATIISSVSLAQEKETAKTYSYAYIEVSKKTLSKKLKVSVDLGESIEQQEKGQQWSAELTNKTSHAAILNYMAERNFSLVETIARPHPHDTEAGATDGIIFIMRKSNDQDQQTVNSPVVD
ncbi:hypothetical protein ORI89_14130 [Sphingobacterium sp. UT-1RO-CII-1]|uniref:hypothetical protein n=1 Tax=Sphingobacterium sp. UT-1RO-CII-1 TaxID=2995225 RepID=UPI00227A22B0|nr:hypothetical protein [Sphingobacterium sp. UT-1RO-CII-1]MCY4780793.1 hypothetical protein [Sphingobacterium sp. UT-1RO-CII-1]